MRSVLRGGVGRFSVVFGAVAVCTWLACSLSGQAPIPAPGRQFALLVGVAEWGDTGSKWLQFADRDAEKCAEVLRAPPLRVPWVRVLTNRSATKALIEKELRDLSRQAGPNDTVYLLISAPGVARPGPVTDQASRGFIYTYRGSPEMAGGADIPLAELEAFLQDLDVRWKFLFADVNRELGQNRPAGMEDRPTRNTINSRMETLLRGVDKLNGLLASRQEQRSQEDFELRRGIFSFYLAEGLRTKAGTFGDLVTYVRMQVAKRALELAKVKQEPLETGQWDVRLGPSTLARPGAVWRLRPAVPWVRSAAWYAPEVQPVVGAAPSRQDVRQELMAAPPEDVMAWLARIKPQLLRGGTDSDRDGVSAALEDRGQEILLRYHLGDRFPEDPHRPGKKDFEVAEHLFREALALRPPLPGDSLFEASKKRLESNLHFCRGRIHVFDERFQEAEKVLGLASKIDSDSPDPHNALGLLYLHAAGKENKPGLLDSAITHFQRAIALAPDWAYPRHNLALSWIEKGEYTAAARAYREAIQRTPQYVYLYCNLGLLFHRLNRLDEAARQYGIALRWFEAMRQEFESRRKRLEREGQHAEAEYLQTRIELLRRYQAETHNALGALQAGFGNEAAAAEQYRLALELNCSLLAVRHNLAMLSLDRYRRAAPGKRNPADLEEAIRLLHLNAAREEPYLRSSEKLGQAYLLKRDYKAAAEQFRAVARAQKDNLEAAAGWISALAHLEEYDEAEKQASASFGDPAAGPPEKSLAAFYRARALGEIYELKEDRKAACSHYQAALNALVNPGVVREAWREVRAKLKGCPAALTSSRAR